MLILALDPSSTACGWSLWLGRALMNRGTVWRGTGSLADYARACAAEMRAAIKEFPEESYIETWYEINDGAPIPRSRQKTMRKQAQGTGRILQALGVEGQERQADSRTKARRAAETALIYNIPTMPKARWEHTLDAVALGHAVVSDPKRLRGREQNPPDPQR